MPEADRGTRYAAAGALSVTTAELLQQLHRLAGGPVDDVESLPEHDRQVAMAATQARSAAAACSALVAQLLTTLDLPSGEEAATARVVEAARDAIAGAAERWRVWDATQPRQVEQSLRRLLGYVDMLMASGPLGGSSADSVGAAN